jgi:hypothetical protein
MVGPPRNYIGTMRAELDLSMGYQNMGQRSSSFLRCLLWNRTLNHPLLTTVLDPLRVVKHLPDWANDSGRTPAVSS